MDRRDHEHLGYDWETGEHVAWDTHTGERATGDTREHALAALRARACLLTKGGDGDG